MQIVHGVLFECAQSCQLMSVKDIYLPPNVLHSSDPHPSVTHHMLERRGPDYIP